MDDSDVKPATCKWSMRLRGTRKLPQRLIFNIASYSRFLWWSTVAVIPATLLISAIAVGESVIYIYTMYCAAMIMVISGTSERFIDTDIYFKESVGEIIVSYHFGDPTLFSSGHQSTVSFEDIDYARFLRLSGQTLVLLRPGKPFAEGAAFLVSSHVEPELRKSLKRNCVSIQGEAGDDSTWWVWTRCAVTALLLGLIPVCVMFIWPVYYSWAIILVILLHLFLILMQTT